MKDRRVEEELGGRVKEAEDGGMEKWRGKGMEREKEDEPERRGKGRTGTTAAAKL